MIISKGGIKIGNITIIDAPCGAGKTSWAIQEMNRNKDKPYIYCTPFLGEISRIRDDCGKSRFQEPQPYSGSKLDSFNELLADGESVAVSHVTFLNATSETLQLIREGEYTLILDECLDVVVEFNKIHSVENAPRQSISTGDVSLLIDTNLISISSDNKVTWCGSEYGVDFKFLEVKRLADLGRLYCVNNRLLVAVFPPEMFKLFSEVYVLTYLFDGSLLKAYFELFNLSFTLSSIEKSNEDYRLIEYSQTADVEFRRTCYDLVTLCDDKKLNRSTKRTLSKSWYDSSAKDNRLQELKKDIKHFYESYVKTAKASKDEIMWTCPTKFQDDLKGQGYTCARRIKSDEKKKLSTKKLNELEKTLSCFVPCNAKATNIYRNRWALAYCCNMFFNPMIEDFFTNAGITPNEKMYALSCLIQWICRSRLRDAQPIVLYIPSKRMRTLFVDWMNQRI